MTNQPIDLGSSDKIEILYTFEENKVKKDFVLVEAEGEASTAFEARRMSGVKIDKKGMPTEITEKGHDASLLLLSKCLFELIGKKDETDNEDKRSRRPVSFDRVKSWPSRITTVLCEKVMFISKLGGTGTQTKDTINQKIAQLEEYKSLIEQNEDSEKNELTTVGSSSGNGSVKTPIS